MKLGLTSTGADIAICGRLLRLVRSRTRLPHLFAVDPLASFLPGHSESDAGTLLEMLQLASKHTADKDIAGEFRATQ